MTVLELRGVRVHNLKGVDAAFPVGRITVVTGLSGAGKSSLVFDTLYAEAQRRYLQSFSVSSRQLLERFDQPDADWIGDLPPAIAVRADDPWPRSAAIVADVADLSELFAELFSREGIAVCPQCKQSVRPQSAADVADDVLALAVGTRVEIAFPESPGEGESIEEWLDRLREDGWVRIRIGDVVHRIGEVKSAPLPPGAEALVLIDRVEIGKVSRERLLETIETGFRRGDGRLASILPTGELRFDRRWCCPRCNIPVAAPEPRLFDFRDPLGACPECHGGGASKAGQCVACHGRRWNERALSVRWRGQSLADIADRSLQELARLFQRLVGSDANSASHPLHQQIAARLESLVALDLGSLICGRDLEALASGETQRLRLHRAFASNLVNALYLFEEPSAGLHPADLQRLAPQFTRLRNAGNTVVIIDHHPAIWALADQILELGPGAGEEGGEIVFQGPLAELHGTENSATAHWLELPELTTARPRSHGELRFSDVHLPPLQDVDVAFPLGVVCVVAGLSGTGKTRLLRDGLYPAVAHAKHKKGFEAAIGKMSGGERIEDVILFDSAPSPRSARSNPATAIKIFDDVRELFAAATDARIRNFDAGMFSFNQPGGRCETCEGQGRLEVDMQFLPDVATTCPECLGRRYRKEILAIRVRGLNIAEVLDLTAREAFRFFRAQRAIEMKLKRLLDVGLDYVRLGQPLTTLSSGETQRLRLAGHLASSRKPRALFILIEPTRGLHPDDVAGLLDCFGQLVATGHSLVIEDQNPLLLRQADYLLELGDGRVVAAGTPSDVAKLDTPTGRFLSRTAQTGP